MQELTKMEQKEVVGGAGLFVGFTLIFFVLHVVKASLKTNSFRLTIPQSTKLNFK